MPPIFWMSSVASSSATSRMSSLVTMPSRIPSASTPGQEREKTLRYLRRQLFQERSPVVGSQARNDLARVFVGQIAHQLVLFRNLEIREDLVRLRPGQRPKNQHPLRGIQRLNLVGQLRGQETGEPFLQFRPATLLDQLLDFLLRDCGRHHSIPSFRKNIRGTLQGRDACPPPAIDD